MAEGDASHADSTPESPEPSTAGEEAAPEESPEGSPEESPADSPEEAGEPPEESPPRRRTRPGRLLRRSTTALVLLVLALATASYAFDLGPLTGLAGPSPISEPDKVPPPEGLTLPASTAAAQVAARTEPQAASAEAVRRALAGLLRDKRLGPQVAVDVGRLGDGTPLFHQGAHLVTPASTMKLLTTTAALEALGPDHRFTTSVVAGDTSKQIVLVGGGDPLLEAGPATEPSQTYPARADLQTLATSTARSLTDIGRTRVHLRYDASLFSGPAVNRHWPAHYVPDGVVSPI
ncbi:MAG TPA: D-alanyl-D-alanine carboxypeptidase, partial [Nocardioidaceae bacterium]|nr:D-alanyl-D-alanine carboxypeptidase [Nocardioidaceae bacterium]